MTSLFMRLILAALIACAFSLPLAPAHAAKSNGGTTARRSQSAHATTAGRAGHHRRNNLGGIHPLVGSGDY